MSGAVVNSRRASSIWPEFAVHRHTAKFWKGIQQVNTQVPAVEDDCCMSRSKISQGFISVNNAGFQTRPAASRMPRPQPCVQNRIVVLQGLTGTIISNRIPI